MEFKANICDASNKKVFPAKITIEKGIFTNIEPITDERYCLDVNGIVLPGFIDAHVHIESSFLIPSQFARVAVKAGVTSVICDPHEIANVKGLEGVEFMVNNAKTTPFNFNFTAPSCVPATVFETNGSILTSEDIDYLLSKGEFVALGEMMNFPGVLTGDEEVLKKLKIAKKYNKLIDGHAPLLMGDDLDKYLSYDISSDHEISTFSELFEKKAKGMKIFLRDGSQAQNIDYILSKKNLLDFLRNNKLSDDYLLNPLCDCIVSDDKHPNHILDGYLRNSLLKAISYGVNVFDAILMITKNPAQHYNLNCGEIAIGKVANFIIVDNLSDFNIKSTYINGECVFDGENVLFKSNTLKSFESMDLDEKYPIDFDISSSKSEVNVNVIGIVEHDLITEKKIATLKTDNGVIQPDLEKDILKIAVVERYGGNNIANAFVHGFNFKKGAIASSVAHDSHNIIVVGTNSEDMACAVNTIRENKGGLAICSGDFNQSVSLPFAGLMSGEKAEIVSSKIVSLKNNLSKIECKLNEPFMQLSFLSLLVIPSIKLSDKGLFDGDNFKFMDVVIN